MKIFSFIICFVANFLFPLASVGKEGGKIPQFTKEAFKVYNTERAIRADSNRINPSVEDSIDFVLINFKKNTI